MVPVRNFRYETVVSGPPRTPISTAEKIVHFGVICVAFFATPGTLRTNAVFRTDYLYSYVNPYLVLDLCLRLKKEKSLRSRFYNFGSLSRNFLKPLIRCWKILRKRIAFVTWPPPQHISWRTSSTTGDWRDSNSSSWWCLLAICHTRLDGSYIQVRYTTPATPCRMG